MNISISSSMPSISWSSVLTPHSHPPLSVQEHFLMSSRASTTRTLSPRSCASTAAHAPAIPQPRITISASLSHDSGSDATYEGATPGWRASVSAPQPAKAAVATPAATRAPPCKKLRLDKPVGPVVDPLFPLLIFPPSLHSDSICSKAHRPEAEIPVQAARSGSAPFA